VVCVGHAALDRIFTVDAWPDRSAKIAASRYEESGGGMMANAAVAISRLGGEVAFCGPLGEDAVGTTIRAQLQAEGVNVEALRSFPGMTSSHSAVLVDARGERLVIGYRGSALHAPADWLPLGLPASAAAVLVDVRWPQGAEAALRAARDTGVPAILDGEVAPAELLESLSAIADHVVFSERGLAEFAGLDVEGGLRRVLAKGARVAAVTRGEAGVFWVADDARHELRHCPAFEVTVVDTLAAGDVFHGAYALAIAEGNSTGDAMRFASAAAAIKCTRPGGRSGAPTRGEVEAFLAR
jgi:sulfofructose kinase